MNELRVKKVSCDPHIHQAERCLVSEDTFSSSPFWKEEVTVSNNRPTFRNTYGKVTIQTERVWWVTVICCTHLHTLVTSLLHLSVALFTLPFHYGNQAQILCIYIYFWGHLADAAVQSDLQPFTYTFIHWWRWLPHHVQFGVQVTWTCRPGEPGVCLTIFQCTDNFLASNTHLVQFLSLWAFKHIPYEFSATLAFSNYWCKMLEQNTAKSITYCVQEFYYKMWQIITKCSVIT